MSRASSVREIHRARVMELYHVPSHCFRVNRNAKEQLRPHKTSNLIPIFYALLHLFKYLIYQRFILISE